MKSIEGFEMTEQYQFLRYYIPGSLSLIYFFGLILANMGDEAFRLLNHPALISLVVGLFASSPALGYVIYLFYDWTLYNKIASCEERRALTLLDTWANTEHFRKGERWQSVRRKELVDFALYLRPHDCGLRISGNVTETIRGFWSNANARITSAIYVPIASGIMFAIFVLLKPPITISVCSTAFAFLGIMVFSVCIGLPAKRTIREAFALEEYIVTARQQEIREYMRLDVENPH